MPLIENDKITAEEIEVASFFAGQYGRDFRNYFERVRIVLFEFKKK